MSVSMMAGGHHVDTESELVEISALGCPQRIGLKKRNHNPQQIRPLGHCEGEQVLAVIVMPCIWIHGSNTKENVYVVKTLDAACALRHGEVVN